MSTYVGKSMKFFIFLTLFILLVTILFHLTRRSRKVKKIRNEQIAIRNYVKNNFNSYREEYLLMENAVSQWSQYYNVTYANIYLNDWEIDKFIAFNKNRDRLIGFLNIVDNENRAEHFDKYYELHGIKDGNRWIFNLGDQTLLRRATYTPNAFKPLSFEKVSILARYFGNFFAREENGVLYFDETKIENYFSTSTIDRFEYINQKRTRAKVIFTLEEARKERTESVKPTEPPMTELRKKSVEIWTRVFSELDVLD